MNVIHKGHNIFISVLRSVSNRQWKPHVKVIWSEDGQGKINTLQIDGTFGAKGEAERGGFIFAKKWIDDGKPDSQTQI